MRGSVGPTQAMPPFSFGWYHDWPTVSPFAAISDRAYGILDARVLKDWASMTRPVHHLFIRIAYQAKTTSLATRLSNSWALNLPALALLRVRLEQAIVCSYLALEDELVGLSPFVSYIPVRHHLGLRDALENADLASVLGDLFNLSTTEAAAVDAQKRLASGFSLDNGKFQRSWTHLDLRSLWPGVEICLSKSAVPCWLIALNVNTYPSTRLRVQSFILTAHHCHMPFLTF